MEAKLGQMMHNYTPPTETEIASILDTVMNDMNKAVNLTEDQSSQIREIQEEKLRTRMAARGEAIRTGKLMEYKHAIDHNSSKVDPRVLALLTEEQRPKYEVFFQQMKANNVGGPMASRKKFLGKDMGGQGGLAHIEGQQNGQQQSKSINNNDNNMNYQQQQQQFQGGQVQVNHPHRPPMMMYQQLMKQGLSHEEAKRQVMVANGGMRR